MRNGTIEIRLPYPIKLGFGFSKFVKRTIGFSFDQRSMFQLTKVNNDIDLTGYKQWLKKTPDSLVVFETLYAGAQSYCIERRIKDNFTKKGLEKALNEAGKETVEKLVKCWQDSEQLGNKKIPGKKKAVSH
jgi:hypothetical protein